MNPTGVSSGTSSDVPSGSQLCVPYGNFPGVFARKPSEILCENPSGVPGSQIKFLKESLKELLAKSPEEIH